MKVIHERRIEAQSQNKWGESPAAHGYDGQGIKLGGRASGLWLRRIKHGVKLFYFARENGDDAAHKCSL